MEGRSKIGGLVDRLLGPRHDYREGVYTFDKLDIPRLKREWGLEQSGEKNGQANFPATDANGYDSIEQRIDNFIRAKRDEAVERANNELMTVTERLANTSVEGRAVEIHVEVDNRIANYIATITNGQNQLHLARKRVLAAQDELHQFQRANRLTRAAHSPESRTLTFGIIFLIFFIESILNGLFLGDAQRSGILGGVLIAAAIASINIAIGFVFGRLVGNVSHRKWTRRLLGSVICLCLLALLGAVNLCAAHYRATLLAGNYKTTATAAWDGFLAAPFSVGDMYSWMLFLMGCFWTLVAAREGWKWDDPYPGYGKVHRLYDQMVGDYDGEIRDVLEEIDKIKDETVEEARALKSAADARRGERSRILVTRQRLAQAFSEQMSHLEGALREFMQAYRDANIRARTTAAPKHFFDAPLFEAGTLPLIDDPDARKVDSEYAVINDTLDSGVHKLLDHHERAHRMFKSIDTLGIEDVTRASSETTTVAP